ncbi:hypothetical protein AVEN_46044-1 [Araneus ventricosus]|uniref:Uncharacterized protein n=1 Tax=Araneus ventricosus TaxID=182803 RepID=A0A4Y1ZVW6_ARAVE|nr:hypothetical protein AVEN_46044-1 [Araneus ventricosus]
MHIENFQILKIVEDETNVRSNLKSVSDVYSWIEEYGRTSDSKWNLRSSRPSGTRLVSWPRRPSGRVLASELEVFRFETKFHRRSAVFVGLLHSKSNVGPTSSH